MQRVIAIVGPTASGKSALAVMLARRLGGEVVSADSRQVYRGLNIGSGKITRQEMQGIPHHLLDVASPSRQFSAARFKTLAQKALTNIARRGKVAIVCGGTGFYIDALLSGLSLPEVPPNLAYRKQLAAYSAEKLFSMLKQKDPARAKSIDRHNKVRLIRALEIVKSLGKVPRISPKNFKLQTHGYQVLWVGLELPETELKKKIHIRLFARIGLEYRHLGRYLREKVSRDQMLMELEREIQHYAKRQMRWFKRNKEIQWFTPAKSRQVLMLAREFLKN
jgi:tRNA dimethylallyltransferase